MPRARHEGGCHYKEWPEGFSGDARTISYPHSGRIPCVIIDGTAHQKKNVNFIARLKGLSGREQRLEEEIKAGL